MKACFDVHYKDDIATAGCILFLNWTDLYEIKYFFEQIRDVRPYESGRFYKRELSCILYLLNKIEDPIDIIIIDGYVWLEKEGAPGLGGYLYHALNESIPVIGVAKSKFKDSAFAKKVFRGKSKRPLYITAAGIDPDIAANCIIMMHGQYRIPTLLKKIDHLCRKRSIDNRKRSIDK